MDRRETRSSGWKRVEISSVLVALIQLACSNVSEDQPGVEIRLEMRKVRSESDCAQCEPVRLENLYTPRAEFYVMREPEFVIPKAESMQAIPIVGGYPHEKIWRIKIDLASGDAAALRNFRESFTSDREVVYLSINGHPLDVITAGQLHRSLIVGTFDSIETLSRIVGKVDTHMIVEVGETEESRARIRAMRDQLQSDEETRALVEQLVRAIEQGDHEKALRLEQDLADRSEGQPPTK